VAFGVWEVNYMNAIQEFCEKRKITKNIESAFVSYCKTDYTQRFQLREGDTVARLIANMNKEQVEDAWQDFVREFKSLLVK
jgi:hypothetical protein